MTYLIPVYTGKDKGFVGGDTTDEPGEALLVIDRFKGAKFIESARFPAGVQKAIAVASNANRRTLTVKNEGANDVYIGGESVTTQTGYRLAVGDAITLELAGELWVVTAGTIEIVQIISELDG